MDLFYTCYISFIEYSNVCLSFVKRFQIINTLISISKYEKKSIIASKLFPPESYFD